MSKKVKIILLTVCLAFTFVFIAGLTGTMSQLDTTKQYFTRCVYLRSSETVFAEDSIQIALKNVSDKDFEDAIIHLIYVDENNKQVDSIAFSEQKVITIKGEKTTIYAFENPGWEYSQNHEIKVAKLNPETLTWETLKTGRDFFNEFENAEKVTIFSSVGILAFLILDILITMWITKDVAIEEVKELKDKE